MKLACKTLDLAALGFALLACGGATAPESQRSELAANRAKWQHAGMISYSFTMQKLCFCAITQPVRLFVANDKVVRVLLVADQSSIDPAFFPTVDSLFAFIDGAIGRAAMLRVTYDPTLGYPTEIDYDGAANAADDEVTYKLSDLHASAPPP